MNKTLASLLTACAIGYSCATLPVSETLTSDLNQEEDSCLELKDLYAYHCPPSHQRSGFCRYLKQKIEDLEDQEGNPAGEESFYSPENPENYY
ncbi:MAG: hypothetical protein AABX04_08475 [Nanoarchaeota archaeon]